MSPLLDHNLQRIETIVGENSDLVIRRFLIFGEYHGAIVYFSSMVDEHSIFTDILKPLMSPPLHLIGRTIPDQELLDIIWNEVLHLSKSKRISCIDEMLDTGIQGSTLLMLDGFAESIVLDTRQVQMRGIEQPQTEQTIRGAREGFIEVLESNISLLRSRLQTTDLRITVNPIGQKTKSKVAVCYLESVANPELIKEANRRLSKIDTDGILDAGYIEQFIEDHPYSPFPQVQNTERPDKAAASLLEGRVILLTDGSPFALIVPAVFNQFYQTLDDYTERFIIGSLIRFIRVIALLFSLFFPALYVSIISFNPELIPTDFAVAVAGGRAGVPYPSVIEVLIMEVSMEVLREATLRMPQIIGGALSIVGVLVIGSAAVSAGFVSPITVVVVALTTIGSFATPAYNAAIALRMLRFPLIIMSGIFGLYGVMIGIIFIINHLLFMDSFGVPYLSPVVPINKQGLKDTLIRAPLWWMWKRPSHLHTVDNTRLADNDKLNTEPVLNPTQEER
ncbi:spore gernimation protein GerA [Paenibacillus antarcticus]|uniref:Spore gernimation protein GerA n=2 Tax=Paenibacillus antarcticus TaxID=253703 RepID=A0A168JDK0_9BACL|nr:spore germination protein [Paenibacillus antarcticus]OAB40486.1 spore gernimation protein GerA [Paenibacillus antarcticus]